MAFLDFFKKKDEPQEMNEPFGPAPGMGPEYPYQNPPYDFPQNQPPMPMQPPVPGQLNPQAYLPNLPPQPMQQNDINILVQTLSSKMDLIANKLDNIIALLNNLLQYYQYMFRR